MLTAINAIAPASASDSYVALTLAQSIPAGQSGNLPLAVKRLDGVTAYDLTGKQLLLTVTDADGNVILAKQATITDAAGGIAFFPIDVGDTDGKAGGYTYDVWLTDATVTPNGHYQLVGVSAFSVTGARGTISQEVTVSPSQVPLAKGDKGDKGDPGQDGTTAAIATETTNGLLAATDKKRIDNVVRNFVADFGADPTGATASDAAFAAAIVYGEGLSVPGFMLDVPPGRYTFTGDVTPTRAMIVSGHGGALGRDATRFSFAAGKGVRLTSPCTVRDIAIYGAIPPIWQSSHAYNVGDAVVDVYAVGGYSNMMKVCTVAGISGASEPAWTRRNDASSYLTEGQLITDGTVTWKQISAPGVWMKAPCVLRDLYIEGFAGDAIFIYGYIQVDGSVTSGFRVSHCHSQLNLGRGIYLEGTDSQGSTIDGCLSQDNWGGGFYDNGDVGNLWLGMLAEDNGISNWGANIPSGAFYSNVCIASKYNRNNLLFAATTPGITGAVEPVWPTVIGGTVVDGTVTWTCVAQHLDGQPYRNRPNGLNGACFIGCYDESPELVEIYKNGTWLPGPAGGGSFGPVGSIGNGFKLIGDGTILSPMKYIEAGIGAAAYGSLGSDLPNGVFSFGRIAQGDNFDLQLSDDGKYWYLCYNSAPAGLWFATSDAGEGGGNPFFPRGLFFGSNFGVKRAMMQNSYAQSGTGAQPDPGTGVLGDIFWQTDMSPGFPDGYRCTRGVGDDLANPTAIWEPFYIERKRSFFARAEDVGAPFAIPDPYAGSPMSHVCFTNLGTATKVALTLPNGGPRGGRKYSFVCEEPTGAGLRVYAQPGQKIRVGAAISTDGGYVECADIGGFLVLEDFGAGDAAWMATSVIGAWTAA